MKGPLQSADLYGIHGNIGMIVSSSNHSLIHRAVLIKSNLWCISGSNAGVNVEYVIGKNGHPLPFIFANLCSYETHALFQLFCVMSSLIS